MAGSNAFTRTITIARKLTTPLYHYARAQKNFLATNVESKPDSVEIRHALALVKRIVELGPTFIKFGQILATRSDILPQSYLDALSTLHDEVPPAPFDQVKKEIEEELGPIDRVFASIEETPIASASLGQVHRARLITGEEIVVKVRRPGVENLVATDLGVLQRTTPFLRLVMESFQAYLFETIVTTFSETIWDEMDYRKEANNQDTIARDIAQSGLQRVLVPHVVHRYTTEKVLVEEYLPGIKITDIQSLDAAGIDRQELAKRLNSLYLEMVINHDIYHADPHPGNIAVKPDGTLILYDFGMVGHLREEEKRTILSLYYAMMLRDSDMTITKMTELGLVNPNTDPVLVRAGLDLSFRAWEGKGLDRTGLNELIRIANKTLHSYPVHLTPTIAELMKTTQMQDGLVTNLDPNFNLIDNLLRFEERSGHLQREISEDVDNMVDEFWESLALLPRFTRVMYNFFSEEERLMDDVLEPPTPLRVGLAVLFLVGGSLVAWYYLRLGQPVVAVVTGAIGACAASVALVTGGWRRRRRSRGTIR